MDFEIFRLHHRGMDCIGVRLSKEDSRNALVKKIPVIKWSQTNRCWYATECSSFENALALIFGKSPSTLVNLDLEPISQNPTPHKEGVVEAEKNKRNKKTESILYNATVTEAVTKFKQHMQVMRYSQNSIQNYTSALMEFLKFFIDENWENLDEGDIRRFQKERIIDRNLSDSYQNTMISAIKMFYKVNIGLHIKPELIRRPRNGHAIPDIFSLEQIAELLMSVKNQKHRMILSIGYGCGLRSGEVIKLKPEDIDADRGFLNVRKGKGNRDRIVPISKKLVEQIVEYCKIYKPKVWIFEGQVQGTPYSQRSLQMVFKAALARNKFPEKYRFHDLRHSYATHMMDAGTNLRVIQEVLGHKNSKTTEIYTHVSKPLLQRVYNPFDDLKM